MIQTIGIIIVLLAAVAVFIYLLRRQTRDEACTGCPVLDQCKSHGHPVECSTPTNHVLKTGTIPSPTEKTAGGHC